MMVNVPFWGFWTSPSNICWRWNIPSSCVMFRTFSNPCSRDSKPLESNTGALKQEMYIYEIWIMIHHFWPELVTEWCHINVTPLGNDHPTELCPAWLARMRCGFSEHGPGALEPWAIGWWRQIAINRSATQEHQYTLSRNDMARACKNCFSHFSWHILK